MAKNQLKKYKPSKLRLEDEVVVVSGKHKGKRGTIMYIDRMKERVIVQGVNRMKRYQRPTQENPQGGTIEVEMPIHISNVMYYDSKSKRGVRLGYEKKEGKKARVFRKAGSVGEIKEKEKK